MTKYVKFISETQIEFPPKNKGNIINYDLDVEKLIEDGYKEFIPAEKEIGKAYNITYTETETQVFEVATEIIPDPEEVLKQAKQAKINENDNKRDIALNQGVTYQNILFDSDTDQKVNLLAMVSSMDASQTIEWYGMNNNVLICTKQDLFNIGMLITQLHTFCWTTNATIKNAINEAETVEQVNSIIIDYNIGE